MFPFWQISLEVEKIFLLFSITEAVYLSNQFILACGWTLEEFDKETIKWIDSNW